jgi:hypothetical protein
MVVFLLLTCVREGSLVMMATVFLVAGLIFPPAWLMVSIRLVVSIYFIPNGSIP